MKKFLRSFSSLLLIYSRRVVVSYKPLGKSVVKLTDRPAMAIAVDMGRKATKTNKQTSVIVP